MQKRISRIFTQPSRKQEAETESEAQRQSRRKFSSVIVYTTSLKSARSTTEWSPSHDSEFAVEPPDMAAGFRNLDLGHKNDDSFPTVEECIAHLKLLECFYRLRQTVGGMDGLFGINDSVVTQSSVWSKAHGSDDEVELQKLELLGKLAEKRWAIFLARAVDRFEAWITSLLPDAKMASLSSLQTEEEESNLCEPSASMPPLRLDKDNLPPADVLMVWHAYMLNPRVYLEDCLRHGRMQLWHTPMPWQAVSDCINSDTFVYNPREGAEKAYEHNTGLPFHNLETIEPKSFACPTCGVRNALPWTSCQWHLVSGDPQSIQHFSKAVNGMLSAGRGYCDNELDVPCKSCGTAITHERLNIRKFCTDVERLRSLDKVPMAGTILDGKGIPWRFGPNVHATNTWATPTPNNILSNGLGERILKQSRLDSDGGSLESIRDMIEEAMATTGNNHGIRTSVKHRFQKPKNIWARRMMSRYRANSSSFALDLVGAVIRQGSFIEKMHNFDWLHSPALPSTMKQLLLKYERFVRIMKEGKHMAVPTLDLDLAWHTHQLSSRGYMNYTREHTNQFIDHDDKVGETSLNTAFSWTSKTYQRLYGESYSDCICWCCEAIRESRCNPDCRLPNTPSNTTSHSISADDGSQKPNNSIPASTDNGVSPSDRNDKHSLTSTTQKRLALQNEYQKACDLARRNGWKEPNQDDYYFSEAWAYPVYIPAYRSYVED